MGAWMPLSGALPRAVALACPHCSTSRPHPACAHTRRAAGWAHRSCGPRDSACAGARRRPPSSASTPGWGCWWSCERRRPPTLTLQTPPPAPPTRTSPQSPRPRPCSERRATSGAAGARRPPAPPSARRSRRRAAPALPAAAAAAAEAEQPRQATPTSPTWPTRAWSGLTRRAGPQRVALRAREPKSSWLVSAHALRARVSFLVEIAHSVMGSVRPGMPK